MLGTEEIQRPHFCQKHQFPLLQFGDTPGEIVHGRERRTLALAHNRVSRRFPHSFDVAHAQSERNFGLMFQRAQPIRLRHIDRLDPQSVPLRVFHQCGGAVKAHRLVVEHGGSESSQIMAFQIGARVCNKREAGGMGFGKTVKRE